MGWENGREGLLKRRKGKVGRKLKAKPQDTPASLPTTCTKLPTLGAKSCAWCMFPQARGAGDWGPEVEGRCPWPDHNRGPRAQGAGTGDGCQADGALRAVRQPWPFTSFGDAFPRSRGPRAESVFRAPWTRQGFTACASVIPQLQRLNMDAGDTRPPHPRSALCHLTSSLQLRGGRGRGERGGRRSHLSPGSRLHPGAWTDGSHILAASPGSCPKNWAAREGSPVSSEATTQTPSTPVSASPSVRTSGFHGNHMKTPRTSFTSCFPRLY